MCGLSVLVHNVQHASDIPGAEMPGAGTIMTMEVRERLAVTPGSTEIETTPGGTRSAARFRAYRNRLPIVPYEYRARAYPWAQAAIAAAEARHGPPRPVCATCLGPVARARNGFYSCRGQCATAARGGGCEAQGDTFAGVGLSLWPGLHQAG